MPQMAPLFWSFLFGFFLFSFMLFIIMNYYIIPLNKTSSNIYITTVNKKPWKL
uniref:ATP synthase F0 subunit 8 n=1 Tax=Tetraloides heterodactylus TaxID=3022721 RepID=UPI0028D03C57|nr:ATP synthase F0 subunit 8 [Tetraloides heterodactylus]WMQ53210.1 ATP synthase F0 subunit 8 [Tetraloides heterodactylus]